MDITSDLINSPNEPQGAGAGASANGAQGANAGADGAQATGANQAQGADGERKFTQAEVDQYMAKVRREERRKAQAGQTDQAKFLSEIKALTENLSPEKLKGLIADVIKGQAQGAQGQAQNAAQGAQDGQGQGQAAAQPTLAERAAQAQVQALPAEVQALIDDERKAREKLQRDLDEERKARAEAKRVQEEAARALARKTAIETTTAALAQAKPGMSKAVAANLARTMIDDGLVKFDAQGKVKYVVQNEDAEFEEDRVREISIQDGAARWARTPESDEFVPGPIAGPGMLRQNVSAGRNSPVREEDMTPSELMSGALSSLVNNRR